MGHDPAMESPRLLRDRAPVHGARLEAEALADAGSPAAAVALLTAAAADLEQDAPGEAGILLAEASAHALLHTAASGRSSSRGGPSKSRATVPAPHR